MHSEWTLAELVLQNQSAAAARSDCRLLAHGQPVDSSPSTPFSGSGEEGTSLRGTRQRLACGAIMLDALLSSPLPVPPDVCLKARCGAA